MSVDIQPALSVAKIRERAPLGVGDVVQVMAHTYAGCRSGTVAAVGQVRPGLAPDDEPLYELRGRPPFLFWRHELALTRLPERE